MRFLGFLPDEHKYQVLAAANVFALASLHEGFGLVFLEAMHCGLPVVATNFGGQSDILEDQRTGFLVCPGDIAAMANYILRLRDDSQERAAISAYNRDRAADFTAARAAARYERLILSTS